MTIDSKNRRHSERVDARINVRFRTGDEYVLCYSQNLSRGGIYLEAETLPDPNAIIELVLQLPNPKEKQITLRGRVARTMSVSSGGKTVHKIAIQFIEVPPELQAQLDLFYNQFSTEEK
jgi:hypothetical protein